MIKEEMKNKYSAFITEISEILGLGKPIDILKLCVTTDLFFQPLENRITELEEKISVLLSCKNCPENKGGFICQKEYEDKCLAQKIQFIKELQEENAELKETVIKMNKVITETFSNLTKAKELLERLLITSCNSDVLNLLPNCSEVMRVRVEAEQFISEVENDSKRI